MNAPDLAARLDAKRNGSGWMARCPAHEDRMASLSIGEGHDGRALVKCHAGCSTESIVAALGLELRDLFAGTGGMSREIVSAYPYTDEHGSLLYEVVRFGPSKDFRQRKPDGAGGWIWNLSGVRRVLYRLPEVRAAVANGDRVWIVEGEKDADTLRAKGLTATCNSGGAGKWRQEYSDELKGADVVIVADRDEPGRAHARDVARSLQGIAGRLVIVEAVSGKDATDHLAAGRKLSELVPIPPETAKKAKEGGAEGGYFASFAVPTLDNAARYGLAGDFVGIVEPHTEADPAALLVQFLVAFGSCAGRNSYFRVEADKHFLNLFALLVGTTSKGRKGTSWGHVRSLYERVDDGTLTGTPWAPGRIEGGLSSGEGLIWAVRDAITRLDPIKEKGRVIGYEPVTTDEGVKDKRLLVLESEFASTLRVMTRDGNTLSAVIRNAWDHGHLAALTKSTTTKATDAHVSIVGHITRDELRAELTRTDAANGFANRFLFVSSRRSKMLPEGGHLSPDALDGIARRLTDVLVLAWKGGELRRDEDARALWRSVYPALSEGRPGMFGAATGRAEAQVTRLSSLYALLDGTHTVSAAHLRAALALWDYCAASAQTVFGDTLGEPIADTLLAAIRLAGEDGIDRTDLSATLGRHASAENLTRALALLYDNGLATCEQVPTSGRPREVWRTVGRAKEAKERAAA